jgi:hypothetical protein
MQTSFFCPRESKARPYGPGFLIPQEAEKVCGQCPLQKLSTVMRQPALLPDRLWLCIAQSPDDMPGGVLSIRKPPCRASRLAKADPARSFPASLGAESSRFASRELSARACHLSTMKAVLCRGTVRCPACFVPFSPHKKTAPARAQDLSVLSSMTVRPLSRAPRKPLQSIPRRAELRS